MLTGIQKQQFMGRLPVNPPNAPQTAQPRFGFVTPMMEAIDSSKVVELFIMDVMGMVIPRTGVEAVERNSTIAWETFSREMMGLINLTIMSGAILAGSMGMFSNSHVNKALGLNPKGTHFASWIHAKTFSVLDQLLHDTLQDPAIKTGAAVREKLLDKLLRRLIVSDPQLSHQVFSHLPEDHPIRNGYLTEEALTALKHWFGAASDKVGEASSIHSKIKPTDITVKIAQQVADHVKTVKGDRYILEKYKAMNDTAFNKVLKNAAWQQWIKGSAIAKKDPSQARLQKLLKTYLRLPDIGVSQQVNILKDTADEALHHIKNGSAETLLGGKSTDALFTETKYFLEQIVDRAFADREGKFYTGDLDAPHHETGLSWRDTVKQTLYEGHANGHGFLKKKLGWLLPQETDGLVPHYTKAKRLITWLPFSITMAVGFGTMFVIHWVTKNNHQGHVFFPGEINPTDYFKSISQKSEPGQSKPSLSTPAATSPFTQLQHPYMPLNRHYSPGSAYTAQPTTSGGWY
ncbi:MAG: hypothetical protein KTR14_08710 [Vampirovibrio sp.]|nr:hypothetical protein [Vampirovibrio sp.]